MAATTHLRRMDAEEALARACPLPVKSAKCACLSYQPLPSHQPPLIEDTAAFKKKDYIHIKEEYDENWWVGRIVGPCSQMVFIPTETKLKTILKESLTLSNKADKLEVYEEAPIMRPVVFLGPSINSSKLSMLLQAALIDSMRDKFAGRLRCVEASEARGLLEAHGEVFSIGHYLDLIHLTHPHMDSLQQLLAARLHPLIVYIEVSKDKVLHKLVVQTSATSRERADLLECAQQLADNRHLYDLVISESSVEDACQHLELFLESYWASTRSEVLD